MDRQSQVQLTLFLILNLLLAVVQISAPLNPHVEALTLTVMVLIFGDGPLGSDGVYAQS